MKTQLVEVGIGWSKILHRL